ncbi:MAG TPA: hypothetical protein VFL42_07765, partial [Terriglobales bacterium]|nr:hypothetical protein [Terriglobales bacterium]
FRELWDGAAIFFRSGDAQHLRETLGFLMSNPDVRREYAALACERARRDYSAERMVESYLGLYHSLAPAAMVSG